MKKTFCQADPAAIDQLKELVIPAAKFSVPTSGCRVTRVSLCPSETNSSVRYADVFGIICPADPQGFNI